MRSLVILGGGTAGTVIVNKVHQRLDDDGWTITLVNRDDEHHDQPGSRRPVGAQRLFI